MSVAFEAGSPAAVPREVLFVEDEPIARKALTRLLTKQGYDVVEAPTGDSAMLRANKGRVGVVLMDIRLDGNCDGIELARDIQLIHPFTSFIFVTAWAHERSYHDRVREAEIRVGGWIEKPIDKPKVRELYGLIDQEQKRLELLARLDQARRRGHEPFSYLQALIDAALVPDDVLRKVLIELRSSAPSEEVRSPGQSEEPDMQRIAARLDAIFDQMQTLAEERAGDPDLPVLFRALEEQLEALEEEEARLIERNYRAHFEFDPEEARHLMSEIERFLSKK